jgi:hypothetical protein
MSEMREGEIELRVAPPVCTPAEHLLNVCTLAAGMVVSPQFGVGTIGADAMGAYHEVIDAYMADPEMPKGVAYVAPLPADRKESELKNE